MRRFILTAVLATLGWFGTQSAARAQVYSGVTYDPWTGSYVRSQIAYSPTIVQAGNVVYSPWANTTGTSYYYRDMYGNWVNQSYVYPSSSYYYPTYPAYSRVYPTYRPLLRGGRWW